MLPAKDVEAVQRWAHERTEPEFRDRVRVELEVAPRSLTVVECSLMDGERWLRVPFGTTRLGGQKRALDAVSVQERGGSPLRIL